MIPRSSNRSSFLISLSASFGGILKYLMKGRGSPMVSRKAMGKYPVGHPPAKATIVIPLAKAKQIDP
jgi:hypothetical protein